MTTNADDFTPNQPSADPIFQVAAATAARMVIVSLQPASAERDEKLAALMENVLAADPTAIACTFGCILSYATAALTECHGSRQGAADLMTTAMMQAFEELAENQDGAQ